MADVGLSQDYRDLLVWLTDTGAEFLLVGTWPNVIELLTQIDGVTFDEASVGHRTFEVDGSPKGVPTFGIGKSFATSSEDSRRRDPHRREHCFRTAGLVESVV